MGKSHKIYPLVLRVGVPGFDHVTPTVKTPEKSTLRLIKSNL